jgi:cytoskeletal protein CcmA (bactofilin family)
MFGSDKRGNHSMAAITTLVAEGTTIRGDIEFSGGLHMDGAVEGSISAQGEKAVLTLSEKGRVIGEIRAPNAVINGQVKGDIVCSERLELAANARIDGNVYYKVLEMAAGAQLNGKMIYQAEPQRQLSGPKAAGAGDDDADADTAKSGKEARVKSTQAA